MGRGLQDPSDPGAQYFSGLVFLLDQVQFQSALEGFAKIAPAAVNCGLLILLRKVVDFTVNPGLLPFRILDAALERADLPIDTGQFLAEFRPPLFPRRNVVEVYAP